MSTGPKRGIWLKKKLQNRTPTQSIVQTETKMDQNVHDIIWLHEKETKIKITQSIKL